MPLDWGCASSGVWVWIAHTACQTTSLCAAVAWVFFFFSPTHVTITDPLRSELETLFGWLLVAKSYTLYAIVWHENGSTANSAKQMHVHHWCNQEETKVMSHSRHREVGVFPLSQTVAYADSTEAQCRRITFLKHCHTLWLKSGCCFLLLCFLEYELLLYCQHDGYHSLVIFIMRSICI